MIEVLAYAKIGDNDVLLSEVIAINPSLGPVIWRAKHFSADDADVDHALHLVALFGTVIASRVHAITRDLTEATE